MWNRAELDYKSFLGVDFVGQQKIYDEDGEYIGYLPWGSPGRSLGAVRWNDPKSMEASVMEPIHLANDEVFAIPDIPSSFENFVSFQLPLWTMGSRFNQSERITWSLDDGGTYTKLKG